MLFFKLCMLFRKKSKQTIKKKKKPTQQEPKEAHCSGEHLTQPGWQSLSDFGNAGDGAAAVAVGEDGGELLVDGIIL